MNKRAHTSLHSTVVDLKGAAKQNITRPPSRLHAPARKYPAQAPTRVFASTPVFDEARYVTMLSRGQLFFARVVTVMLIPLILVHPVARVYADEITDVPPPATEEVRVDTSTSDTTTPQNTETENISTPSTDSTEQSAPTDESETPPDSTQSSDVNEQDDGGDTTATNDNGSLGDSTEEAETQGTPDDTPATVSEGDSTTTPEDSSGGDTSTVTPPQSIGGGSAGSTTEEIVAGDSSEDDDMSTSSEDMSEQDATDTDATEISTEEESTSTDEAIESADEQDVAVDESEPTADDVRALEQQRAEEAKRAEEYRTERLRAELRKEVEQEFLRGCITFEASGYYCLKDEARTPMPTSTKKTITTVESSQGDGGDKEIFVTRDGVRTMLTNNDWDDTFPAQDATGEQFVWQGMKNGRWQIFMGTLSPEGVVEITQITDSRESNFNPKIDGDHIVWQGWVDGNWEIFLATKRDANSPFAGEHLPEGNALLNVGNGFAVERLTTNSEHDMFPSLHGDIVTWQSHVGDDWVVNAYSISAKTTTQLSADGAKGENPRFALTWEERDNDGHARLVGYDISTGEKTDLTREAMRLPSSNFPTPTQTPITQPDPAALPVSTSTGTSTTSRGDGDGGGDNPLLP